MNLTAAVLLAALMWLSGPVPAVAQEGPARADAPARPQTATRPETPAAPSIAVFQDSSGAQETRDQLQRILRQLPPAVGEVLQRDPSLLNRPDYLAPYPVLVSFLSQHPEIARNPSFFLGTFYYHERDPKDRAFEMLGILLGSIAGAAAFVAFISLLVWLIRAVIDHRRWLRLSRVQTEVHTKLMDRLTTNEDLLAYIQSPAGRRFLESAPIALDGEPRPTGAPFGRILWSLQAGIVLVALGVGFWFARVNVFPEVAEGFYVLGVIAMALGAGFAVSAVASYFISNRLGLFSTHKATIDG
jgi:hypothetical protein